MGTGDANVRHVVHGHPQAFCTGSSAGLSLQHLQNEEWTVLAAWFPHTSSCHLWLSPLLLLPHPLWGGKSAAAAFTKANPWEGWKPALVQWLLMGKWKITWRSVPWGTEGGCTDPVAVAMPPLFLWTSIPWLWGTGPRVGGEGRHHNLPNLSPLPWRVPGPWPWRVCLMKGRFPLLLLACAQGSCEPHPEPYPKCISHPDLLVGITSPLPFGARALPWSVKSDTEDLGPCK